MDEGLGSGSTYYADTDGDGYGDAGSSVTACSAPTGYVSDDTDCDDTDATVYPGAPEIALRAANLMQAAGLPVRLDPKQGFDHGTFVPMYVAYPKADLPKAKKVAAYTPPIIAGMEAGFVALYQKCVHLGCRVPWCQTSQWFECPCHGSKYNRVGEKKGGPAPRGLDRFGVTVDGGVIVVDTKQVVQGPPIGTNTTGQEQEGPHCN